MKNLLVDQMVDIRQIECIDTQPFEMSTRDPCTWKEAKIQSDTEYLEKMVEFAYAKRMAVEIYACVRRDCTCGCDDYHLIRDGCGGNNSQYKVINNYCILKMISYFSLYSTVIN